ncbi:hypothetical protein, partial [uncultured Virgibacillus sp.]|uniref:hypothetical protein n=1 Tax=uncultured Virgibacillus sp. TaxID=417355 RepID=UPI00261DB751
MGKCGTTASKCPIGLTNHPWGKTKPHGWKFHFIPHITGSKIRPLSNKVNPIWVSVEQLPVNVRLV